MPLKKFSFGCFDSTAVTVNRIVLLLCVTDSHYFSNTPVFCVLINTTFGTITIYFETGRTKQFPQIPLDIRDT